MRGLFGSTALGYPLSVALSVEHKQILATERQMRAAGQTNVRSYLLAGDQTLVVTDETPLADLEEALQAIEREEAELLAACSDEQRAIGWGDCFLRIYREQPSDPPLLIFGEIPSEQEFWRREEELGGKNLPLERKRMADVYRRGYRFAQHYSQAEPRGEPGETHISQMRPLGREQFELARACSWQLTVED